MNNIEKIIEYITVQTTSECYEISLSAIDECERIHSEYQKDEQAEYWKAIDAGTRETEMRLDKLNELAALEAKKQIDALQIEMLDAAFALAAQKLLELPAREYDKLLVRLGLEAGTSPDALLTHFREELTPAVVSALFD